MQDNAPWVLIKGSEEDRQKCGALLNACAGLCVLLAALVEPFMPSVTRKVFIMPRSMPSSAMCSLTAQIRSSVSPITLRGKVIRTLF